MRSGALPPRVMHSAGTVQRRPRKWRQVDHRSKTLFRALGPLAMCLLIIGAFAQSGLQMTSADAQSGAAPLAAPVAQCNDDGASNVGGQGISCTVTIANFVTSTGAIDPARPT